MITLKYPNTARTEYILVYGALRSSNKNLMSNFIYTGTFSLPEFKLVEYKGFSFAIYTKDNRHKIVVDLYKHNKQYDLTKSHQNLDDYEELDTYLYNTSLFKVTNQGQFKGSNAIEVKMYTNNHLPEAALANEVEGGDFLHSHRTYPTLHISKNNF
jgi:gamma-glutamylcyclotransferase (GGCT)/AIG2-like uncharacterized protein YtfP